MAFSDYYNFSGAQGGAQAPGTQGEVRVINGAPYVYQYGKWLPSNQAGQTPWQEAQQANEARLKEIMGQIEGSGTQEAADIRQRFGSLAGGAMQDLVGRGLRATTLAPALQTGIARQEAGALGGLRERVSQQKAGILERVEDQYPDVLLERMFGRALGPTGIPLSTSLRVGGRRRSSARRTSRRTRAQRQATNVSAYGAAGGRNVVREEFMARRRGLRTPGATPGPPPPSEAPYDYAKWGGY